MIRSFFNKLKKNNSYHIKEDIVNSDYDLIRNSVYFDYNWYLNTYKDVREQGMDPVEHYLNVGWTEYRRPGPSFSTLLYLNRYNDVNSQWINPLLHFEKYGKKEKRISSYEGLLKTVSKEIGLIENSKYFDSKWYYDKYLQNDLTCEKPSVHYFCLGCYLGMNPSSAFSNKLYKREFPEVKNIPYLLHYETYSKRSGKGYLGLSTDYYSNIKKELSIAKKILEISNSMMSEENRMKKKVMLISHVLNLTGAPRVLYNMAKVLQNNNFYTVIISIGDGPLREEIEKNGIPVLIAVDYEKPDKIETLYEFGKNFDFMVFSTVESFKFAHILKHTKAYKIAWVHEGEETLKLISEPQKERINIMDEVYSGSHYCNSFFEKYLKDKNIRTLYYGIDQAEVLNIANSVQKRNDTKKIFVIAGTIGRRKGFDILAEAYQLLEVDDISNLELWIVGGILEKDIGDKIELLASQYDNIKLFGQVTNDKLIEIIKQADILLCPSIDDPLPVVVTDAFIMEKPVVVTEMVGTSVFINNEENGFVIKSGNAQALANVISDITRNKYDLESIGRKGKIIFDNNLSQEKFESCIIDIFDNKKIRNEIIVDHMISNMVYLVDIKILPSGYNFIFKCDVDNELIMLCNDRIYQSEELEGDNWSSLNSYLINQNEKVISVCVNEDSLLGEKISVSSIKFSTIELHFGDYSWLSLNKLAQQDFCIRMQENVISVCNKENFFNKTYSGKLSKEDRSMLMDIKNTPSFVNNIYVETRNNKNDNAYKLFLYDLKMNKNAYFITSKEVIEKELNPIIKKHMSIINSEQAKKLMVHAKNIVVSWYATPIFGENRMRMFYPFLNLNYTLVSHGISYDKDSFYLNYANWGKFRKVICCSEYEREYFQKINGHENVMVLGYPRMDKWFNTKLDDDKILVFPSWRDKISETYVSNICDLCNYLHQKFKDKKIIYISHPSIERSDYYDIRNKLKNISGEIETLMSEESELFNYYFSKAKFLITDYSSVAYDFAYKNGISIYYNKFIDEEVHYHMNSIFYDANCGIVCKELDDVYNAIKQKKESKNTSKFFKFIDDKNTCRVYEEIMKG